MPQKVEEEEIKESDKEVIVVKEIPNDEALVKEDVSDEGMRYEL